MLIKTATICNNVIIKRKTPSNLYGQVSLFWIYRSKASKWDQVEQGAAIDMDLEAKNKRFSFFKFIIKSERAWLHAALHMMLVKHGLDIFYKVHCRHVNSVSLPNCLFLTRIHNTPESILDVKDSCNDTDISEQQEDAASRVICPLTNETVWQIYRSSYIAVDQCQRVFRNHRWNCSTSSLPYMASRGEHSLIHPRNALPYWRTIIAMQLQVCDFHVPATRCSCLMLTGKVGTQRQHWN